MWVILKEPIKNIGYEALAIHLESFNAIAIVEIENEFQLVVQKYFDGHQSNQSNMHCLLCSFDTYKKAQAYFQVVIDAIHSGSSVFDCRSQEDSEKKSDQAYL